MIAEPSSGAPSTGLSVAQLTGCLAVLLVVFLFWGGPIWRHPFEVDAGVLISYALVVPLVLGCLVAARRLTVRWLLVDSIVLATTKFAVTYAIATGLWIVSPPPGHSHHVRRSAAPAAPTAPAPTPLDPRTLATIEGTVSTADGAPAPGVLVYVADGLEDTIFPVPDAPVRLEASADGIVPRVTSVQTYQRLSIRSTDGVLHTVAGVDDRGERVFNRAAPGDGTPADVTLYEDVGPVTVACRVHATSRAEPAATVGVFAHPFHAVTDAAGRFRFHGVPAGELVVAADQAREPVRVAAGGRSVVNLVVSATLAGDAPRPSPRSTSPAR